MRTTPTDDELVAIHEAAHVAMYLATGLPIKSVSVIPTETVAGHVSPKRDLPPQPRTSLVLGLDPETTAREHSRIMVFLAGSLAEYHARGFDISGWLSLPQESTDYKNAEQLALSISQTQAEGFALLRWLHHRTVEAVTGFYFQQIVKRLVPPLLERKQLSEAEVLKIAADVLNIGPKTLRGRLHLRWRLFVSGVRRTVRRLRRR